MSFSVVSSRLFLYHGHLSCLPVGGMIAIAYPMLCVHFLVVEKLVLIDFYSHLCFYPIFTPNFQQLPCMNGIKYRFGSPGYWNLKLMSSTCAQAFFHGDFKNICTFDFSIFSPGGLSSKVELKPGVVMAYRARCEHMLAGSVIGMS